MAKKRPVRIHFYLEIPFKGGRSLSGHVSKLLNEIAKFSRATGPGGMKGKWVDKMNNKGIKIDRFNDEGIKHPLRYGSFSWRRKA
jgi:hypothetical protein